MILHKCNTNMKFLFLIVFTVAISIAAVAKSVPLSEIKEGGIAIHQLASVEDGDLIRQSIWEHHPMYTENLRLKREAKSGLHITKGGRNMKGVIRRLKRSPQYLGGREISHYPVVSMGSMFQNPVFPRFYPQVPFIEPYGLQGHGMPGIDHQFY